MYFKQIAVEGMGCLSYIIGCPGAGVACVVDPKREVRDYIDLARNNGMRITHIFETHIHADHVSGNMELRSRTGAEIYLLEETPATYKFNPIKDGDSFMMGSVKLEILKTPGHTPHGLSILVTDTLRSQEPWLVLTGDCMFVGDVGRPDLAGEELIDEQIENLYNSLYNRLGSLADSLEVFPAHGEGSLCGKGMSSKPSSTIGFEQHNNPLLNLSRKEFSENFKQSFPERPKSFTHIIDTNIKGAPLLDRCPMMSDMSPLQVKNHMEQGAVLLDTRDTAAFGGAHIPGSINIGLTKQTANWIGMVIDPGVDLILLVDNEAAYDQMCTHLHMIGYDNILGYLYGGIKNWQEEGYPLGQLWQLSSERLDQKLNQKNDKDGVQHFFDVRTQAERNDGYIAGSEFFPLPTLLKQVPDIPKDEEVIVFCGVGYRGNIAASYLQSQGFDHVHSLAGGYKAWRNAGFSE